MMIGNLQCVCSHVIHNTAITHVSYNVKYKWQSQTRAARCPDLSVDARYEVTWHKVLRVTSVEKDITLDVTNIVTVVTDDTRQTGLTNLTQLIGSKYALILIPESAQDHNCYKFSWCKNSRSAAAANYLHTCHHHELAWTVPPWYTWMLAPPWHLLSHLPVYLPQTGPHCLQHTPYQMQMKLRQKHNNYHAASLDSPGCLYTVSSLRLAWALCISLLMSSKVSA